MRLHCTHLEKWSKIVLATSGMLRSLSGGGKAVLKVKYRQRPENELLKFPEETAKHSENSCPVP